MRRGQWLARPLIGAILTLLVGCSAAPEPGPSRPTFPATDDGSAATAASRSTDSGVVPDDCSRILPVDQLVAVLGLPLNSIVVRTTVGVPAPSVGRLERMIHGRRVDHHRSCSSWDDASATTRMGRTDHEPPRRDAAPTGYAGEMAAIGSRITAA